jgi:protein-S-isoprenylcysteine O-methyltransferase Ste14
MYTAMIIFIAGLAIALGSDWMLVLVVPAALTLHFGVVKREERYLEAKFGESNRLCAQCHAIGCNRWNNSC